MLSPKGPHASCAGGRFGSESNWRSNVWKFNFDPLFVELTARCVEPSIFFGLYMTYSAAPGHASFYTASPVTLPVFQANRFVGGAHFPFGIAVDPD